jgi:predicted AlkP superfamily phosphohydrolase/phosphomutase
MKPKVLVVGLDSGTFRFIKPFAEQGWLPNLHEIMKNGVTRVLKSTIPPLSPPAWTTFLTGTNPGRHGIFHFLDIDAQNYNFTTNRLINSSLFSGQTFIDFMSQRECKIGAVKIPFTYPPWKINGTMISGEPSPDWKVAHTYPPDLSDKIGQMNLGSARDFVKYSTDQLHSHLKFDCDVRTKIACDMLKQENFDFFMMVHTITDAASHRFWKYSDATCPNYSKKFEKYANLIREVYAAADSSIGKILQRIGSDTTIFFMSDHGASRKPIHFFQINAWLKQRGYLYTHSGKSSAHYLNKMLLELKNLLPSNLKQVARNRIKRKFQGKLASIRTLATNIDWSQAKVYAVNLYNSYDGIVLNLKGRQAEGLLEPGASTEALCKKIRRELLSISDPRNGKQVVQKIWRRDEVFSGPYTERIPDLVIQYHPDYRSGKATEGPLFSDLPATDFDFQSGDHDEDGIFIAIGPDIQKNVHLQDAHIQDMAPTILYTMGLPVPGHMEGRVLVDIFNEEVVARRPVKEISDSIGNIGDTQKLNEEEEEEMKAQLKGLGYL